MKLRTYVLRRLILFIPIVLGVSVLVFLIIHAAPGSPVDVMFAHVPANPETKQMIMERYHLDDPLYVQYFSWLNMILHGNLGYSFLNHTSVNHLLLVRIGPTLELVGLAILFAVVFAVLLGTISAVNRNTKTDYICTFFGLMGRGFPNFLIGMILILILSLKLGWLPSSGMESAGVEFGSIFASWFDHIKHLIMPVIALGFYFLGYLFRIMRSSMLDVLGEDYVTTARAKGLKENLVIYKHSLRNALLPSINIVGIWVGRMFGMAAVIETLFGWPGVGSFIVDCAFNREYLALMSTSFIIIIMVLAASLAVDVLLAYLDPRIKY